MQRITHDRPWPLFDAAATRMIERAAASTLAPHTLMQRAGLSIAKLAMAVAPHSKSIWIACGPGNNGGDGFEAAMHLLQWGKRVHATWLGDEARAPADALASFQRARDAGVVIAAEPPHHCDLAIDGLLGVGGSHPVEGAMAQQVSLINALTCPVLSIDLPTGLAADTGSGQSVHATHTLSLLTLKPGLFTHGGRDACGDIWFDDLGIALDAFDASATLSGPPDTTARPHASHKGSFGDVAIIGGAPGMSGAALLAASAALHGGAGRVFVALLDASGMAVDATRPELMFRAWASLDLTGQAVACGCGGGDAVRAVLPKVISAAKALVLDADALNAIANDPQLQSRLQARGMRGRPTVLTPHPLEAARLLGSTTLQVQADRLAACREIASRYGCSVVLKGSGTIIADAGGRTSINPTGNARLATAGTGDVLAGLIAARLAAGDAAFEAAASAVFAHGLAADHWPIHRPLTAAALAARL
ncbi:bifunctional ADP-dependent NAD(P)H-hydrate dehydratase/NAD(P)H-hydrate epimerase [Caenimonas sp. SL110]|uniref:bifunctional ADP-dependent NAD(P)H-hydrate dehydratase/NAD(P)H-hydrate epimerase n=1 Tax=Caenimonas sp. SL110 TaxID=1450524 RepID=UPI0006549542|nr:bifunctional ADP-dependent NAD(P)H-hydrate dehydratase/NAD(P)H-hydrate epimerase [Caenimonas sp. SL110]